MKFRDFVRKIKYGQPVIVVSGLPRSGTSMLMKMLEASGLKVASDGQRTADTDNPKGYYELERVKELDKGKDKSWVRDLRGKTVKVISYLLKDLPEGHFYKVVFLNRDLNEVMASQNKMLKHRCVPFDPKDDGKMIRNFEAHLQEVQRMLHSDGRFDVLYLNHRDILNDPHTASEQINRFLGGHLEETKMSGVVDHNLYRNRA
ncbi:MAG: sulfotransferase domain-containing protein [bacterium]